MNSATPAQAAVGINKTMNFQGRLLTAAGAVVADGNYNMRFRIYQDGPGNVAGDTGGSLMWTELWQNSVASGSSTGVVVKNGYFSVNLGTYCAFAGGSCQGASNTGVDFDQDTLWMSMDVAGTAVSNTPTYDGEMLPMRRLASSVYSLQAENANKLGGLTSSQFLQTVPGSSSVNVIAPTAASTVALTVKATTAGSTNSLEVFDSSGSRQDYFDANGSLNVAKTIQPTVTNSTDIGLSATQFRTGYFGTSVITPTLDTNSAVALNIGTTNATSILLNQSTTVAAGKSLTVTGGNTASRPSSPSAGQVYYDTTTNQLLQYNGTKWTSDHTTSTKIVAASNSSQADKDAADYIATGTGDQATINSALTAAAGGLVYLMEGTYGLSAAISVPNNTVLAGAGAGTIITIPNNQNTTYNMITNTDTSTGTRVTIRDLQVDGNKSNQSGAGNMQGIYLDHVGGGSGSTARDGAVINDVWVRNIYGNSSPYGIHLVTSANSRIENNTVVNTGSAIMADTLTYSSIAGNNTQGSVTGIFLFNSNNDSVSGNTAQGNINQNFWIYSSSNIALTGNSSQGGNDGVYIYTATNNTISGNSISGATSRGIEFATTSTNNIVTGNKIHDTGGATTDNGIYLSAASNNSVTDNDITDTSCSTTCYAINVADATSANNYFANNHHTGTAANGSTINDAGSGTIYANQPDGAGNLINKSQGGGLTVGAAAANSSLTLQGGFTTSSLPTPAAPTLSTSGTTGGSTYGYKVAAVDGLGETLPSTETTISTGNFTLSSSNKVNISWVPVGGAYQYKVYRSTGAGTSPSTGLIATVNGNITTFSDTGIAASGAVAAANTTGGASFAGLVQAAASLNVTGSATASVSVLTPLLDANSAAALNIGTNNATSIGLKKSTTVSGALTVTPASDSLTTPQLKITASGGGNALTVATSSTLTQVGIALGSTNNPTITGNGLEIQGALKLGGQLGASSVNVDSFITPVGSSVSTKINIPYYDPTAFGQIIAMGIPVGANSTARVISLFDARSTTDNQPALAVFSPSETYNGGFSWDGVNTSLKVKTNTTTTSSSAGITLQSGNVTGGSALATGDVSIFSGTGSGTNTSSGNINIDTGAKTGSGISGSINIGTGNAPSINLGSSLLNSGTTITGTTLMRPVTDSTTELQVTNSNNEALLTVDTTTTNLLKNSGFEAGTANWAARGTTSAFIADTTAGNVYHGTKALKSTVTAAASGMQTTGGQAAFTTNILPTTQYQLTFFARCSTAIATLTIGREDVAGTPINVVGTGACDTNWRQFTAHWTTGATITNPLIFVTMGGATSGSVTIDAVSLVQTSNSGATNYAIGKVMSGGIMTNPVIFQNTADSTLAFQVQNAAGTNLLAIDSVNSQTVLTGGAGDATLGAAVVDTGAGTNDFPTGWTATNWTTGANSATHTSGNTSALSTTWTPTVGTTYQVSYNYNSCSSTNTLSVTMGGVTLNFPSDCMGTNTSVMTATSTAPLSFAPSSTYVGTVSSVTIKPFATLPASALTVKNSNSVTTLEVRSSGSSSNTFIGLNVGRSNTSSGLQNTGVGSNALQVNTTGSYNSALGDLALQSNTIGSNNTAVGYDTLASNTTGNSNTGLGYQALVSNRNGNNNVAVGYDSLYSNASGSSNTAVGQFSMFSNTTGFNNVAIGSNASQSGTSAAYNVAIGYAALQGNLSGVNNIAIGTQTLNSSTASNNTGVGYQALNSNTSGNNNVAFGNTAILNNTTGSSNTGVGSSALGNLRTITSSITATANNAGFAQFTTTSTGGLVAGTSITISGTTSYNGTKTVQSVDSGTTFTLSTSYFTADAAGTWTTAATDYNTAFGGLAGNGNGSKYAATGNSLFGYSAGLMLQTGANYNSLFGYNAGSGITTGTQNVLLGYNAGTALTSGSNNVLIGSGVVAASATGSNQLQIGAGISGDLSIGTLAVKTVINSTTAFQVQNTYAEPVLTVDTTTNSLIKNSGFEAGTANWAARGTTSTFATDSTPANVYHGTKSLEAIVTAASSGVGTTGGQSAFTNFISNGMQYQLTFFAKCSSTINTLTYGREDVAGTPINSTTTGTCTTSWQQYTAHWTTGGTITNPDIYVTLGSATSGTLWVDGVSLVQTGTNAATNYSTGKILEGGIMANPTIFQNNADSTTAFQIQNAASEKMFGVDTVNAQIKIGDSGGAGVAASLVQEAVARGGSSTLTTNISTTSGHLLVATIGVYADTAVTVSSVTDSAGNTWVKAAGGNNGSGTRTELWYAANANAVTSVVVTLSGTTAQVVNVSEYSGVATASPLDNAQVVGNTTTTAGALPSITTSQSNELLVGNVSYIGSITATGPGGDWQSLSDVFDSFNPSKRQNSAYRVVSAAGAYTGGWTLSSAASSEGVVAAFKTAGGAASNVGVTSSLVVDSAALGYQPAGVNGAMYYDTALNKFRCYEAGAWTNCIGAQLQAGASANVQTGNISISGIANALTALQTSSLRPSVDGSSALRVQNASGTTTLLTIDTTSTAEQLIIGNGTNKVTFANNSGHEYEPVLSGNARHTKTITLSAEYPGATMSADGTSNTGTMTSDNMTSSPFRNYYQWANAQGTAQDYDIWVKVPVPSDFAAWPAGQTICVDTYASATTANGVKLNGLYDTGNSAVTLTTSDLTPSSSNTWQNICTSSITSGTYTAGGVMTLDFKLTAPATTGIIRLGDVTMNYLSKW